jgi:hypothetical protein
LHHGFFLPGIALRPWRIHGKRVIKKERIDEGTRELRNEWAVSEKMAARRISWLPIRSALDP